jgi:hypothetical protein
LTYASTLGWRWHVVGKSDELDRLISEYSRRLNKARAEAQRLEIEIAALVRARRAIFENDEQLELPDLPKTREISREWKEILRFFLQRLPNPVSIDEVMGFIADHGFSINRNAVRSQLHVYVARGFLERLGEGLYRATDAVKPLCL